MNFEFTYVPLETLIEVSRFIDGKDNLGKQVEKLDVHDTVSRGKVATWGGAITTVCGVTELGGPTSFTFVIEVEEDKAKSHSQLSKIYGKLTLLEEGKGAAREKKKR